MVQVWISASDGITMELQMQKSIVNFALHTVFQCLLAYV